VQATLTLKEGMHFVGTTDNGLEASFDASRDHGGTGQGPSPMQMMLQSVAACSALDIVSILHKRRRTITSMAIDITAERADTHPRVFTSMHLHYRIVSPDATNEEVRRAIELSQDQYCSASAVVKRSGCPITWDWELAEA